jgi:23S rRNA (cytosine1962-C5)-methyltransferase
VEGIRADEELLLGPAPAEIVEIREEGLRLEAAPRAGQKTGHYADQRENRRLVGALAADLDVLDLYAGSGGFSLQCLTRGAGRALAVESSPAALAAARRNAARNDVAKRFVDRQADVSATLADLRRAGRRFGLVIADPPNFFPRGGASRRPLRAYRELTVRALSRVEPGGFLATFSCSARLDAEGLLALLRSASRECRREVRVLRALGAGPDHPVAAGLPEGRYLAGFLLQVDAEATGRPAGRSMG